MKKTISIVVLVVFTSIILTASEPAGGEERTIGFSTALPDHKFHLGTEKAIQVVKDFDKLWVKEDYTAMKKHMADTAKCFFWDGTVVKSSDGFVKKLKADSEGSDHSWTFDYAYSVDLDPTRGGEHVQAGFTGPSVKDGIESKRSYHEWYYIVEGKIVMWRQYTMEIME